MIRLRRDQDLERLVALLRAVYVSDGYPVNWPNDPRRWLTAPCTLVAWICEEEGEPVGHIALTAPDPGRPWRPWQEALDLPAERLAVMRRLFVAPSWRRRGVGTHLIKTAEREASAQGRHLVIDVAHDHHAAMAFWKKHGWRHVGEATLPPGDEGRPLRLHLLVAKARHQ